MVYLFAIYLNVNCVPYGAYSGNGGHSNQGYGGAIDGLGYARPNRIDETKSSVTHETVAHGLGSEYDQEIIDTGRGRPSHNSYTHHSNGVGNEYGSNNGLEREHNRQDLGVKTIYPSHGQNVGQEYDSYNRHGSQYDQSLNHIRNEDNNGINNSYRPSHQSHNIGHEYTPNYDSRRREDDLGIKTTGHNQFSTGEYYNRGHEQNFEARTVHRSIHDQNIGHEYTPTYNNHNQNYHNNDNEGIKTNNGRKY